MDTKTIKLKVPYISVWDGGTEVRTSCVVNTRTGLIEDITISGRATDGLDCLDREYIIYNDEQVDVIHDEDADERYILLSLDCRHLKPQGLTVETPLGTLVAESKYNADAPEDYPGIYISLAPAGCPDQGCNNPLLATVEFDSGADDFLTCVYGKPMAQDEPTDVVHHNMEGEGVK